MKEESGCDVVIYSKYIFSYLDEKMYFSYVYLVFLTVPGLQLSNSWDFPNVESNKVSFVL